jgi:peroxiredoxin family protein/TusA-related sulfurtransferase/rhodanese-related sulfurtransferase
VDDLSLTQLCYSPPFGSARDVVNIAGLAARNIRSGLLKPAYSITNIPPGVQLVDVRPTDVAAVHPIPSSINIPSAEIAKKAHSLDKSIEYRTVCNLGKTSYFAHRHFVQAGLKSTSVIGGLRLHNKPVPMAPTKRVHDDTSSATKLQPDVIVSLDCTGLACPGPLLKMKEALKDLPSGATLKVTATDPGFPNDAKSFAATNNLTINSIASVKGVIQVEMVKGESSGSPISTNASLAAVPKNGATIVLFSQDYDKAVGAFVIANGAKAMGGDVTVFCTFWGLNVLRHPKRHADKPKTFIDSMFGAMMPKGINSLPLSNMNFAGMGPILLKDVMKKKNLPNLPGLIKSAQDQGVKIIACTMSMDAMGIQGSELIDGVEYGGVAAYLEASQKSATNLFI